jgi:hypothetical protein
MVVVWIMLAYSCWRHTYVRTHARGCRARIRSLHVRGRARRRASATWAQRVYSGRRIRCGCFRSQATRTRSSRVTTPSIHQFIIHLMTERARPRTRAFLPCARLPPVQRRIPLGEAGCSGEVCNEGMIYTITNEEAFNLKYKCDSRRQSIARERVSEDAAESSRGNTHRWQHFSSRKAPHAVSET